MTKSSSLTFELDYSVVRTRRELFKWACKCFSLSFSPDSEPEDFLLALYDSLAKQGRSYQITELNVEQITPEVNRILNGLAGVEDGWKLVLSFHLFREGAGASVAFTKKSWRCR